MDSAEVNRSCFATSVCFEVCFENSVVDGVKRQRSYRLKLPWRKEEREEYNRQIDELRSIVPSIRTKKRCGDRVLK